MHKHNPVADCVVTWRAGKLCLAATLLAVCFASGAQADPAPQTPATQPPGTSKFSLPFGFSTSKPAESAAPATQGVSLPFNFSPAKALEPTTLPAPASTIPVTPASAPVVPETATTVANPASAAPSATPNAAATNRATNPAESNGPETVPHAPHVFGTTPEPTPETRALFDKYVDKVADPENTLDLIVGKPRILMFSTAPGKVLIPDEKVASYDLLSPKELSVAGVTVGTTVLNLWFPDNTAPDGQRLLSYYVRVLADPETKIRVDKVYEALEHEINKAFPNSLVHLQLVGRNLIVTGEAKDASEADKIISVLNYNIVGANDIPAGKPGFVGTAGGTDSGAPNSAANVATPATPAAAPDASDILSLSRNGIGGARVGGNTSGRSAGRNGGGNSFIINMLRVPGENQVMLRVTVAEVNRDAARSIGLNFTVSNSKGIPIFANLTGGLGTFASGAQGGQFPMLLDNGQLGVTLEALRSITLAKSLAEPNLVTVNGQNASFQAGGKFPVPVVTGATATGLEGVQYIPFGVSLNFTPYITEKNMIRLQFSAEVSTRDATTGTSVGGSNVPGVDTRNVTTVVDLKPGQTLAVAGLVQSNYGSGSNRIPFFGEIPVLANLLGESQSSASEQELVMLITAELIRPMDAKDVPPLPGSNLYEPSDVEFFLGGKLESRDGPDFRSATRTDFERLTRYQRLQRAYLFGPAGYSDGRTGDETHDPIQPVSAPANHS